MATVTLDLSKAVPLPQAPVQIDMSKAQPLPQAEDTRSLWQKAKDNFNAATQGPQPGDGLIKSAAETVGAGGGDTIRSIGNFLAHPIDTTIAAGKEAASRPIGEQVVRAVAGPAAQVYDLGKSFVHDPLRTIGQVGTGAILGEATAPVVNAISATPRVIANAVSGSGDAGGVATPSLANKLRIGNPPTSLTPAEQSAVAITKAVNPAGAAWNNFLDASRDQIGNIVDYAKRNNLPISDARDLAKAAKGAQQETLSHYQQNFLNPNSDSLVSVKDTGFQGPTNSANETTLGQVDSRINAINQELNSSFRKPTTGQAASAVASDADLIAEKRNLTDILHNQLAAATGTNPEDIAALRVRGGQLKTIASESQGAANSLASGSEKADAGAPSLPTSQSGLVKEALNFARGGPERIAAGKLRKALTDSPIQPTPLIQPGQPIPTPEAVPSSRVPVWTGPQAENPPVMEAIPDTAGAQKIADNISSRNAAKDNLADTNKAAAQAEFLKAQELDQAAQDAAKGRNSQASSARMQSRVKASFDGAQVPPSGSNLWSSQGYANVVSHLQNDPTSGITRPELVKFGLTPEGKQILVKASGITPGSPMMRTLVQQIKQSIGD